VREESKRDICCWINSHKTPVNKRWEQGSLTGTVDLLVLTNTTLLLFLLKILLILFTKQANSMRRSNVLGLSLQLVFPGGRHSYATVQIKRIMRQKMACFYKTFSGTSSLKLFTAVFNISSLLFVTVSKLWRTLIIPNGVQHNDIQHENKRTRLSIMMLNTMTLYTKCCYGECRLC